MKVDPIDTPRLRLTRPLLTDAPLIFARYASDPDVVTYVGFSRHRSVADTEAFIRYSDDEWAKGGGPYLVWSRDDGTLLGSTGIGFEGGDVVSTGYAFARDAWGHGYATESLFAMIDLAERLRVPRLIARVHPDHHASARVLQKGGFMIDAGSPVTLDYPNLDGGVSGPGLVYSRAIP